jgi:hypothetical protein
MISADMQSTGYTRGSDDGGEFAVNPPQPRKGRTSPANEIFGGGSTYQETKTKIAVVWILTKPPFFLLW